MEITKDIMERYVRGLASEEEVMRVEQWLEVEEENRLPPVENEQKHLTRIWDALSDTMYADAHQKDHGDLPAVLNGEAPGRHFVSLLGIAASILLVSLAGWFFFQRSGKETAVVSYTRVHTGAGERKSILLPDGSTAELNGNSELKFPGRFTQSERLVELKGEAFFSVTKDPLRPFVVTTDSSRTQVLGTRFNLTAYADKHILTVEEGKVSFALRNATDGKLIVMGGQQATLKNGHLDYREGSTIDVALGWKTNTFVMENETLAQIAERLEQWYGVDVKIKPGTLRELTVTGTYRNASLEKILKGLSYTTDIHYKITDKVVEIY